MFIGELSDENMNRIELSQHSIEELSLSSWPYWTIVSQVYNDQLLSEDLVLSYLAVFVC
jgi:hypothetical protein